MGHTGERELGMAHHPHVAGPEAALHLRCPVASSLWVAPGKQVQALQTRAWGRV